MPNIHQIPASLPAWRLCDSCLISGGDDYAQIVGNETGIELQKMNVRRDVNNMLPPEQVEIGAATKQAMAKMMKVEQFKLTQQVLMKKLLFHQTHVP